MPRWILRDGQPDLESPRVEDQVGVPTLLADGLPDGSQCRLLCERAAALGARVRVQSRWLHAISVDAPTTALRVLAQDRQLRRIQPLGRFRLRTPPRSGRPTTEQAPPVVLTPTAGRKVVTRRSLLACAAAWKSFVAVTRAPSPTLTVAVGDELPKVRPKPFRPPLKCLCVDRCPGRPDRRWRSTPSFSHSSPQYSSSPTRRSERRPFVS